MNIGIGITGSFCTHEKILEVVRNLASKGYNVIPIVTDVVYNTDTRFGKSEDFLKKLKEITKNEVRYTIVEVEPFGTKNTIDLLVIAPCTGNTLAKLANGITDNAVTMTAKALLRNNKPIVVGISTNDGLGASLQNIATLLNTKNFYLVPFGQDDSEKKPKSLVSDWAKVDDTILKAMRGEQIQPILV